MPLRRGACKGQCKDHAQPRDDGRHNPRFGPRRSERSGERHHDRSNRYSDQVTVVVGWLVSRHPERAGQSHRTYSAPAPPQRRAPHLHHGSTRTVSSGRRLRTPRPLARRCHRHRRPRSGSRPRSDEGGGGQPLPTKASVADRLGPHQLCEVRGAKRNAGRRDKDQCIGVPSVDPAAGEVLGKDFREERGMSSMQRAAFVLTSANWRRPRTSESVSVIVSFQRSRSRRPTLSPAERSRTVWPVLLALAAHA